MHCCPWYLAKARGTSVAGRDRLEAGGKLVAVDARTGRVESLGVSLPAVDQVAIRP
jgi:hypothetical protein